jgi:diguanylate cyclase (GGDEF)-like protein
MGDRNNNDADDQLDEFVEETQAWTFEAPAETGGEAQRPYLIFLSGPRTGSMVRVEDEVLIGRSEQATVRVDDVGVSKLHVSLTRDSRGRVVAKDLGSRNGTYVNDVRRDEVLLEDGDKIRIGSTTILKFSYQDTLEETFQQQMFDAALRDALTQVYNRRYFVSQLASEFAFAVRHQVPLALIFIDVDHFKRVNDEHGHLAGDAVLSSLAKLVLSIIRKEDLLARYGGEEFCVLCRSTDAATGQSIAERIRRTVEKTTLVRRLPELRVTISAGVAALPDRRIGDAGAFVDAADKALYLAKESGRNRVRLYNEIP